MKDDSRKPGERPARILVVEDDREMCRLLSDLLRDEGYEVEMTYDGPSALARFRQSEFQLTITDLMMPGMKGTELVRRLKEIDADAPVLVITAFGSIESAVETMQAGAYNYLTKPFLADEVLLNVSRALEQRRLQKEVRQLREEVQELYGFDNIIGKSPKMRRVYEVISQVSDAPTNVLVTGESGTGKELITRAIHYRSSRSRGPFVAVNSAALPEALMESELFGSVQGAFTDAKKDRKGLFREASGGTLFLDEIGELPLTLQAKLLRVIEDREVRPVGASRAEKVDVRILAASNRTLEDLVREGKFRQDLFYRLNVIRIDVPPLRERVEDIPLLADYFIQKFSAKMKRKITGITPEALSALVAYHWPGNVRELENAVERAVLLGKGERIGAEDLPLPISSRNVQEVTLAEALSRRYSLRDLEREYIRKVLEATGENKTEAAGILGVDRTTLYRKLEEQKVKEPGSA